MEADSFTLDSPLHHAIAVSFYAVRLLLRSCAGRNFNSRAASRLGTIGSDEEARGSMVNTKGRIGGFISWNFAGGSIRGGMLMATNRATGNSWKYRRKSAILFFRYPDQLYDDVYKFVPTGYLISIIVRAVLWKIFWKLLPRGKEDVT